ncbi:MAG: class I adenylate-forming enzyme family protein [Rhodococcus sp. (in: high G+C Gram-positive bacteria)]
MTGHDDGGRVPRTLPEVVVHWASVAPNSIALVHGDVELTYAELQERCNQVAGYFDRIGVRPGDRIVVLSDNSLGWVLAFLAGLRLGAIVSPANNRLNASQFAHQCDLLDARLIVHDMAYDDLAQHADRTRIRLEELEEPLVGTSLDPVHPWPSPDSDALVSFTSGTTGVPKGAVLSHTALVKAAQAIAECVQVISSDSTLVLVPLFHNTGFVDQLGAMLTVGGSTHLLRTYRTADAIAELTRKPVTYLTAVPSILRLLMVADEADALFSEARAVLFGGSPMPSAWSEELLRRWPHLQLVHGYGLTEFTSGCTTLPPDLITTHGESVGVAVPGVTVQVTTDDGRRADVGETGEVWVMGPTRMSRYWEQPDLTARKIRGPWLLTGDLGYLDDAGLLWLTGRVDDVINRGGEKVLPAHVESKIAAIAAVAEATVFAVPDEVLQNRVAVALTLRNGHDFDIETARASLHDHLPDYAVPERWIVYDELPRTGSGKSDRRAIARDYLERQQ